MNVCYACGKEVSWAWEYICPTHGKGVMICTQERWNELQELRRLQRIEEAARIVIVGNKVAQKDNHYQMLNNAINTLSAALEEK